MQRRRGRIYFTKIIQPVTEQINTNSKSWVVETLPSVTTIYYLKYPVSKKKKKRHAKKQERMTYTLGGEGQQAKKTA